MSSKKGVQLNRKSTERTRTVRKVNSTTNLKINIPSKISTEEEGIHVPIVKGRRPPQFKKKLDNKTKVELANSVARQQLVKEEPPVFQLDNVVYIKNPNTRGRKRKVISDFFKNCIVVGNNTSDAIVTSLGTKTPEKFAPARKTTPQKQQASTRRILTRKRLAGAQVKDTKRLNVELNPDIETLVIKIEDTSQDDELNEPVKPEYEPAVRSETIVVPQTPVALTPPEPEPVRPQPTAKKTKSTLKLPQPVTKRAKVRQPTCTKKGPKGKQQNKKPAIGIPSILDLLKPKTLEAEENTKQNQQKSPELVGSRKNSVGSSSNKSWTRDISSSSNNTCIGSVSSNDIVRIDNKLPIVKLTNIDSELEKHQIGVQEVVASADVNVTDEHLSDHDSESLDSEKEFSVQLNDSVSAKSLLLSTSPSTQFTQSHRRDSTTAYAKAANELNLRIKALDIEIINWMGSDSEKDNANLLKLKNKISETFDNEFKTITNCRRLKEILEPLKKGDIIDEICGSDPDQDRNVNKDIEQNFVKENAPVQTNNSAKENTQVAASAVVKKNPVEPVKDFVKPKETFSRKVSSSSDGNLSNASTKNEASDDEMQAGTSNSDYNHHDDDDALSLFAESMTGFESTRMNPSTASAVASEPRPVEEYIPKPVKEDIPQNTEKHIYCPTKITEDNEVAASKVTTVCEKQNADSTSIYKQSNSTDDAESYQESEHIDADTRPHVGPTEKINKPRLMDSYFEGVTKTRSVVFHKLCFYNLINSCRKIYYGQCRFIHLKPSVENIKEKVSLLDDNMLIQEYLLLRKWNNIRRRYGMCYVEECFKRGLTRVLVEMAYDFITKARNDSEEDTRLRVNTIELTLLHLNSVDMTLCEDLLKLAIPSEQGNRTLLCDVLMATMSITQNFTRFRVVFLNLTYFMVNNQRTFNMDVVKHIMERVCILPFDEAVARALIQMMRLTNSDILNNPMIGHFEKQISVNNNVFEEYAMLKNQCAFSSMLASSLMSVSSPLMVDTTAARCDAAADPPDPQPPTASPDTTNLDNMQKTVAEPSPPVITRNIGMNPLTAFNQPSTSYNDSRGLVTAHSDTNDDSVKVNVRPWQNRSIFQELIPLNRSPMRGITALNMRPPMHPHMRPPPVPYNQRLVTFRSPSKFVNRHPRPNY